MTGSLLLATSATAALPFVAIAIAIATFVASQREFGRRAKVDYVDGLEKRIEDLEEQNGTLLERIEDCEKDRRDLKAENFKLMRRVLTLEESPS